jgi:ubiquinone/menaquinone biosynthesis C-methylase UbiE
MPFLDGPKGVIAVPQYVHGYSDKEKERLYDQAQTLADLLHTDIKFEPGSKVLEAGCGTGAQTVFLAPNNPEAHIISIDRSETSLAAARKRLTQKGITNVDFRLADIYGLDFEKDSFDHIFVCFVLEHLEDPLKALDELRRVLKPGGLITAIEGDHGSFYCHPESAQANKAVDCLIEIQARMGGNACIGRQLFPLLTQAHFADVSVTPKMVYVDDAKPALVDGFSKKTFIAMVEGVKEQALDLNLIDETTWQKGITDLYRATQKEGTFCYTFFKGRGLKA